MDSNLGSAAISAGSDRQRELLAVMLSAEESTDGVDAAPRFLSAEVEAALGKPAPAGFLESPLFVAGAEEFDSILGIVEPDPQTEPDWWIGRTIDHYTLLRLLPAGIGGQGYVFEADEKSAVTRTFAFKLLR